MSLACGKNYIKLYISVVFGAIKLSIVSPNKSKIIISQQKYAILAIIFISSIYGDIISLALIYSHFGLSLTQINKCL